MNKKAIWESTKELLRIGIFAGVSAIVTTLLETMVNIPQTEVAVLGTVVLRLVDKFLHEWGKELSTRKSTSSLVGGLTRF